MAREYRSERKRGRPRAALFLALTCATACLLSTAQDETVEVPLTDTTQGVSPFEVHGKAFLHDVVSAPEIEWCWGQYVTMKNVSDKPITLALATLTEVGRHTKSGRSAVLDSGPTYFMVQDRFFRRDIMPADSVVLRDTKPGVLGRACCINPIDEVRSPEAEFKVLFVQYADGSIFGDPTAAEEVFARRKASLAALGQLVESRADDEKRFGEKLDQQCAALGPICPRISQAFEQRGKRGALTEIRHLLAISAGHANLLATPYSP
jgi:hypothetical protein